MAKGLRMLTLSDAPRGGGINLLVHLRGAHSIPISWVENAGYGYVDFLTSILPTTYLVVRDFSANIHFGYNSTVREDFARQSFRGLKPRSKAYYGPEDYHKYSTALGTAFDGSAFTPGIVPQGENMVSHFRLDGGIARKSRDLFTYNLGRTTLVGSVQLPISDQCLSANGVGWPLFKLPSNALAPLGDLVPHDGLPYVWDSALTCNLELALKRVSESSIASDGFVILNYSALGKSSTILFRSAFIMQGDFASLVLLESLRGSRDVLIRQVLLSTRLTHTCPMVIMTSTSLVTMMSNHRTLYMPAYRLVQAIASVMMDLACILVTVSSIY